MYVASASKSQSGVIGFSRVLSWAVLIASSWICFLLDEFELAHEEPHRIPFLIKLSDGCYAQFPVKFSLRFRACQSGLTSIVTRCHRRWVNRRKETVLNFAIVC